MANLGPSPDTFSTMALSPKRRASPPLESDPAINLPPGAEEPRIYREKYPSPLKPDRSKYSLLRHETHLIEPFMPGSRITSSPTPMSSQPSLIQHYFEHPDTSQRTVLWVLIRKTSLWVLAGVMMMILGIGLSHALILPHIHTCPVSATCPETYDPNTGNSLQLLQSFISYWLKAGVTISSIGILKLSAYQAWFILMHHGNTVKNLDLNLGAIRGSVTDACYLLFKKNNRLLSAFVFALLGIGAAISLVTGLSIDKDTEIKLVTFQFNSTSEFPNSKLATLNNDGQLKAIQKVIPWALDGDKSHGRAFRGTLVVPDARTLQASNALPGGPTITGHFECEGWDNYTTPDTTGKKEWHIWIRSMRYIATADMSLSTSMWRVDTAMTAYLWVSNTTGLIPNATLTDDGGMNIALCTHYLEMLPQEPEKPGFDYLISNEPSTSGCDSDKTTCVADSVNNAILNWWGGTGTAFWHITCRGGVLGPVPSTTDAERYCPLTQELWQETAIAMLDGIMQTAPKSRGTRQDLHALVEGLDRSRWWLNAIIPAATMVVYLIGLWYTCILSKGDRTFKELTLWEVVRAAQTDHVHDLILSGQLKKRPIRFDSNLGFVDGSRSGPVTIRLNS
ncbi:hypothetical protein D9756_006330 [Leucocoprinus leucothites]|uniref:Uncharacterized protein n=1 Tax=Leucocoprinus leucothites TaxID=201217 RepID=A0A8H5D2T4_9AGAR|nr:hypothetical protein D9756_006330 [Leucoagaricus leucothites]